MTRISNISFFRFCWENGKLDWPKCARTPCAQGKYNFEHISERYSRLCRKFPDLDFFYLLYLDVSLPETQYMLL